MDAWRARLLANRELILDDDEEDEGNLNVLLGVGMDDEDEVILPRVLGISRQGKTPNIDRDRYGMHERMMRDYFSDTPIYGPSIFRWRYHMRRSLFLTILDRICAFDDYFVQKWDAFHCLGLSPH
jgi:hypothetical protein